MVPLVSLERRAHGRPETTPRSGPGGEWAFSYGCHLYFQGRSFRGRNLAWSSVQKGCGLRGWSYWILFVLPTPLRPDGTRPDQSSPDVHSSSSPPSVGSGRPSRPGPWGYPTCGSHTETFRPRRDRKTCHRQSQSPLTPVGGRRAWEGLQVWGCATCRRPSPRPPHRRPMEDSLNPSGDGPRRGVGSSLYWGRSELLKRGNPSLELDFSLDPVQTPTPLHVHPSSVRKRGFGHDGLGFTRRVGGRFRCVGDGTRPQGPKG